MASIKIDEKDYDVDSLSEDAKEIIASLRVVDAELQRLKSQIAIFATARNSYAAQLNEKLKP